MLRYIVIGLVILAAILLLRRLFGRGPKQPVGRQPPKLITMDGGAVTAEVDGQELEIDAAVLDEIRRLADSGQKIEAVKRLREVTGLGLTEAKNVIESLDRLRAKGS